VDGGGDGGGAVVLRGPGLRAVFQTGFSWGRSDRSSRGESKGGGGGVAIAIVIALVLIAVAWLLSIVIRFALSRKREFLADAGSVELTKNPDAMISALRKIEGRGELPGANSAVMEMCLDNPREGFSNIFDTHPSVKTRVHALVEFAGGHDPGPLALPELEEEPRDDQAALPGGEAADPTSTPTGAGKPFLPSQPPVQIGGAAPPTSEPGPWGPHRRS